MIYIRTGLPGASKTLNSLKELVHSYEQKRPFYYHNIRLLILDIEVCRSFSGWYYGWYFPNLKDESLKSKLIKIMKPIHENDEFLTLDDVPFLKGQFESHNHFQTFLYWVRRVYPEKYLQAMEASLDGALSVDGEMSQDDLFDLIRPFNLDFKHFDDPNYWFDLPKGSKILIDECQQFFPPRQVGSRVPQAIAKLETHRHGGYDLHFVTQDATLADQNLRKLVGRHVHFFNPFGGKKVTRKESPEVFNPKDYFQNKQATKKTISHPTEFYGSYYSAEIHTHKFKLPKILIWLLILPMIIGLLLFYLYDSLFSSAEASPVEEVEHVQQQEFKKPSLDVSTISKNIHNPLTDAYNENVSPTEAEDILQVYINTVMTDVYISGSMYRSEAVNHYDYAFYRTTDNATFDPYDLGLEVQSVSRCLALVKMGGISRPVTCNPFYVRAVVDDDDDNERGRAKRLRSPKKEDSES